MRNQPTIKNTLPVSAMSHQFREHPSALYTDDGEPSCPTQCSQIQTLSPLLVLCLPVGRYQNNEFEAKLKTYIQRKYTNLQIKALGCKLDIFTPYATLDAKRTYDDDNETF